MTKDEEALFEAVIKKNITGLRNLIEIGTNIHAQYNFGNILHGAVLLRNFDREFRKIIEFILKTDIDVNAKNKDGVTALHLACFNGDEEIVEMLLKAGASVNVTDNKKDTPLMIATEMNHPNIVTLLKKAEV